MFQTEKQIADASRSDSDAAPQPMKQFNADGIPWWESARIFRSGRAVFIAVIRRLYHDGRERSDDGFAGELRYLADRRPAVTAIRTHKWTGEAVGDFPEGGKQMTRQEKRVQDG
jgi:hypothetical protein